MPEPTPSPVPLNDNGSPSHVGGTLSDAHLKPTPGHSAPLPQQVEPAPPAVVARLGRYEVSGEVGRGGMGCVLRGRDPDLGRDLAIKVLLEKHHDQPEVERRFLEEAQIGGQLQHPGVVPVYEVGRVPGEGDAPSRPYFTMKLVQGQTLAELLRARQTPADELPRFVQIFEQVAQTVAFAHVRGVIHRDLKPLNVMVGDFGEVQLMDWGLAKVLGREPEAEAESVHTVRSEREDVSQQGAVLGTPAYMSREQARGDVEAINRRSDVFGLGAILCEILTGKPPYTGGGSKETLRRAAAGLLP
jgi:serine/threonine-protein kinase